MNGLLQGAGEDAGVEGTLEATELPLLPEDVQLGANGGTSSSPSTKAGRSSGLYLGAGGVSTAPFCSFVKNGMAMGVDYGGRRGRGRRDGTERTEDGGACRSLRGEGG